MTNATPVSPRGGGAPPAYQGLVQAHHAAVFRTAWRLTRSRADAEDVTQQVFLQLLERHGGHLDSPHPERLLRWLAARTALQHLRGEHRRRRHEEEVAVRHADAAAAPAPEADEARRALVQAVAELPEELRLATILRYTEGLTFAELAECAGVAEPTAFDRVRRAIDKLRARLVELGHAGAVVHLEAWLTIGEPVAVPATLATSLLALSPAAATSVALGSSWVGIAAAALVVLGGVTTALYQAGAGSRVLPAAAHGRNDPQDPIVPQDAMVVAVRTTEADAPKPVPAPGPPATDYLASGLPSPLPDWETRAVATGRLRGVIVDELGAPVRGAAVRVHSYEGAPKSFAWRAEATTGSDGAFELTVAVVVPAGQRYTLDVRHADLLPFVERDAVRVEAGATVELGRVAVPRNATDRSGDYTLTLQVQTPDGAPVEKAWVRLSRALDVGPDGTSEVESGGGTDAAGVVQLHGQRVGAKRLVVDGRHLGWRLLEQQFELRWPGPSTRTVTLEAGLEIRGRILFPADAEPAPGALQSVSAAAPGSVEPLFGEIAPGGTFRIGGLDPGSYAITVRSRFSPAVVHDVAAGRQDLEIPLKRPDDVRDVGVHLGEIHGRVVDAATGLAVVIPFDVVEAAVVTTTDPRDLHADVLPVLANPRLRQTALDPFFVAPDPASDFHLTGLWGLADAGTEPATYVVIVRAAGYAPGFSAPVTLRGAELVRDVVVLLHRPARARGTVRDSAGRPVAGAQVFATSRGAGGRAALASCDELARQAADGAPIHMTTMARTDAAGRFEVGPLAPSVACALGVVHPAFAPALTPALTLEPGKTCAPVDVELLPRAR